MKTKIISTLLALGLITNAAIAGNSARIGYASDYFYRGAQKTYLPSSWYGQSATSFLKF